MFRRRQMAEDQNVEHPENGEAPLMNGAAVGAGAPPQPPPEPALPVGIIEFYRSLDGPQSFYFIALMIVVHLLLTLLLWYAGYILSLNIKEWMQDGPSTHH